ncbi:MAG: Zn-ribbon domain-containing OB-fold protein [Armatimonadetes bacterium]|nr:Zn-ribbon domain-containing OB-fold protein [Armatimonadota bacterium]
METLEFKGTALSDEEFKGGKVVTVSGAPNAQYGWDAGVAIGRFLHELKEGRLIGTFCRSCNRIMVPPRMFCEWCFRNTDEWAPLKDTGVVNTFSLCYVTWDMKRLKEPEMPAVIEIDGASPGMGIMHLLGEVDPKKVQIGMKVRAVWKPADEREGAITDIKYFKPM